MQAAVPPMSAPLCLVHNEDCKLSLNPAALAVLRSTTQPVVVVAIVGPFGSGKSFLMKQMAQKCTGFSPGDAVQMQTKGIWMWCLRHPCKPGVALVLLDTEGLGDPSKGDSRNDAWIFTLALLLSSTLVYNSKHTNSYKILEGLWFLMDLTHHVRVRAQVDDTEQADEFARIFPHFVWVMRDFRLQEGEQPINTDEYLERMLRPQLWFMMQKHSKLQRRLRSFFPHQKLFILERPAADRELAYLELLREDQLQPSFRRQEEAFCQHIWKEAPVKVLLNSSPVTGRVLACLLETYMAAITTGSVPYVESTHMMVAEAENSAVVEAAVAEYRRGMEQGLVLPTASHNALMAMHQHWKQRAVTFFLSNTFANSRERYQALLMDKLEVAKEEFCRRNEDASEQRCHAVLQELWRDVEPRVQHGDYMLPGGMQLYQEDLRRVREEYKKRPDKGVKAKAALEEFLRVKGQEMTEMQLDRVNQQFKVVLAEAAATTQAVKKQMEEQQQQQQKVMLAEVTAAKEAVEKQLEEQQQQQQMVELTKIKEAVEQRVCFLEKQQKATLAEVAAVKKAVEKQLEEQQQQQQVMLAEVTAAKKAVEKQLEEQQQQQKVMLAEVTAAKKAVEKQLEEQQQQQKVMLAEVTAAKKAVEKQLVEQQQQQVALAKVTAAQEAVEAQLEEQQQQVMLAEVTADKTVGEKQLEERWQQWAQQLQEQNLVLSQRLEELEARLQEGREREVAAVELMQEEQTVPSWRSTLLKFLDKVVMPILIRLVNSMVNNGA